MSSCSDFQCNLMESNARFCPSDDLSCLRDPRDVMVLYRQMIELCHDAGFKFQDPSNFGLLDVPKIMQEVPLLKSLCRITIRHKLGSPLLKLIGSLGLPELITDYLMFTNECVVSRGQLEELFGDIDCLEDEDL